MRSVVKGEMSAKTTHQRSAKGPTSIGDCSADGTFVTLENTGRKVCVSSHWLVQLCLHCLATLLQRIKCLYRSTCP